MLSEVKAERTLTSPPNGEVPVTMVSCISCLKELVKTEASSQLNLLNHLWLLWGKPSSKNILLPLHSLQVRHSNPYCSHARIVQLETGSNFSVLQRRTQHLHQTLDQSWGSFSAATHPATASQSQAGSSSREGSWISAMGCDTPRAPVPGQPCLFTSQGTAVPAWPQDGVDYYTIIPFQPTDRQTRPKTVQDKENNL